MKTEEKMNNMLDELYRQSTPPITWKEIQETYRGDERSEFYMKHRIDEDTYARIVSKHLKKMTQLEQRKSSWVLLDYAPTCNYNKTTK